MAKPGNSKPSEAAWRVPARRMAACLRPLLCLCLALSLLLPGSAPCLAAGEAKTIPQEVRFPKGSLKIGDPVQNALQLLGRPIRIANQQNYCWRSPIDIYGREVIVKALPANKQVFSIVVRKQQGITTPEGIGVGSGKKDVIARYGEPTKQYQYRAEKEYVMCYGGGKDAPYLRVGMSRHTDKVVYFIVGIPAKYPDSKKR